MALSGKLPIVQDGHLSPERVRALWESSLRFDREKRPDKALESLQPLLEAFPENPIYLSRAGETYTLLARHREAAQAWEKFLLVAPRPTEGCPQLGQAYAEQGLKDKALDAHQRCLALDPTKVDLMLYVGLSLERKRLLPEAKAQYEQILSKSPDYSDAKLGLARVLIFQGKTADAEPLVRTCLNAMPSNPDALLAGALFAESKGAYDYGIRLLEKAIPLSPTYEDLRLVLDRIKRAKGVPK